MHLMLAVPWMLKRGEDSQASCLQNEPFSSSWTFLSKMSISHHHYTLFFKFFSFPSERDVPHNVIPNSRLCWKWNHDINCLLTSNNNWIWTTNMDEIKNKICLKNCVSDETEDTRSFIQHTVAWASRPKLLSDSNKVRISLLTLCSYFQLLCLSMQSTQKQQWRQKYSA